MTDHTIHHLSIIGNREQGLAYAPVAQEVLRALKDRMAISGMFTGAQYRRLGGADYCYVRVAGGVNTVSIVAGYEQKEYAPKDQRTVGAQPPDMQSGVVTWGLLTPVIDDGDPETDDLPFFPAGAALFDGGDENAGNTQDRLGYFYPTALTRDLYKLPGGRQLSARLAVRPFESIAAPNILPVTQHNGIRPTMYSGRMKSVVQAILGLGRVPDLPLYRKLTRTLDDGEQVRERSPSPFESDVLRDGYQVRYDFRWFRTHGIGVGGDGRLWLVEIGGTRGMVAMPLPLNEYSLDERYRKAAEKLGDNAILACLDEFGGVPTGESFPGRDEDLEAMIRAGLAVRLLEKDGPLKEFYDLVGLCSPCGWAFNDRGNEAHNTGIGYREDGLQFCAHYQVKFEIGKSRQPNGLGYGEAMFNALSKHQRRLGYIRFSAAIAKLDYMEEREANQQFDLLRNLGSDDYMDYLDQLTIAPIAVCAAGFGKAGEGNMANMRRDSELQLKLWEPNSLDPTAIVSHDFSASKEPFARGDECDTTVFVFFAENTLKTVKWFSSHTSAPPEVTTNYESCMYIGSWFYQSMTESRQVPRGWYSSDFDGRNELSGGFFREDIRGRKLGHTGAAWNDHIFPQGTGSVTRSVLFELETKRKKIATDKQMTAVVCNPAYFRECYYFALLEAQSGLEESVSYHHESVGDAWSGSYKYELYNQDGESECGPTYKMRHIDKVVQNGSPCALEVADSGPWLSKCQLIAPPDSPLIGGGISPYFPNPSYPPPPPGNSSSAPYKAKLTIKMSHFGGVVDVDEQDGDTLEFIAQERSWFLPSPETVTSSGEIIGYQMRLWATANTFGDSTAVVYQPETGAPEKVINFNGKYPVNQGCFIGWVSDD